MLLEYLASYTADLSSSTVYILIFAVSCLLFKLTVKKGSYQLPPGPTGLPIFGYLPFLGKEPHRALEKLRQKYGNVLGLYFGKRYVVVLGDYLSAKEGLEKEEFLNRPEITVFNEFVPDPSVIIVNGKVWRDQRRFAIHQLRDLGFGKSRMEEHMLEESSYFVKEILRQNGKPKNFRQLLSISTANNIRFLLFGHRKEYDDPVAVSMDKNFEEVMTKIGKIAFLVLLPEWLLSIMNILRLDKTHSEIRNSISSLQQTISEELDEHRKTFDPNNIRDYVDGFLLEMSKKNGDEKTSFNDSFLSGNALVFFEAGSDTVRTTISWMLLLMAKYQDIQDKAHKEIMEVIGKERFPNWSDHLQMPYCSAVIAEIHRFKTIVPLSVERGTIQDTTFRGYHIPKGTMVYTNIWAIHNDPTYWKNPEEFNPTRFLSQDGTKYIKNERLMPFTTGRRSCPGELMAHIEVFLYFVSMLQRFKISAKEGKKLTLKGGYHVTYQPADDLDSLHFQQRT